MKNGWSTFKDPPAAQKPFYAIKDSLSTSSGCLFYGSRLVIPASLQQQILETLHLGHFGMQRMKQLARTAVYWPDLDAHITDLSRSCMSCQENHRLPPKQTSHPWMLPEEPWSRVHIDHAVNFKGHNWLVMVDALTKYPCIHQMTSITTKATTRKLDEDFAHFGYPHTIVSDNAQCFSSEEFKSWCRERGIVHLQGAPSFPATNGAAERLVQSFKQSLKKSSLPPGDALQEFLMQYRRTPLPCGSSPSELLNGRQIRTKIDVINPLKCSPRMQSNSNPGSSRDVQSTPDVRPTPGVRNSRDVRARRDVLSRPDVRSSPDVHTRRDVRTRTCSRRDVQQHPDVQKTSKFQPNSPCFALSFKGGRKDKWIPGVVTTALGHALFEVSLLPDGLTCQRQVDHLRSRYVTSRHRL